MKFAVRILGADKARGQLAALGQRLENLEPAYLRSSVVVLTAAQGRIRAGGPGWAPTAESSKGSSLYRTGALFRSLQVGSDGNVSELSGRGIKVGTNLKTPDGNYSIGRLMQYGTGPIKPKNGKVLVFEINGQKIFSKGTKGIPVRPFLYFDQETSQRVLGVFSNYISGGLNA